MFPTARHLTDAVQRALGEASRTTTGPLEDARRLMRSGRLMEATAALQRGLGAPGASHPGTAPGSSSPGSSSPGSSSPGSSAPGSVTRGASGSLAYRLYVPTGLAPGAPLVVMLHGGTQDAEAFAGSTGMDQVAERGGFAVVYPEQSRAANAMGYWNWFRPGDQRRGAGEPSLIAGITSTVARAHDVDPGRVFVAGFSAGAAMAAVMVATYPDLYAGAGVHSGLPYGAAHDVGSAFAAMSHPAATVPDAGPVPLVVVHGDQDRTVAPANADALVRAALPHGHRAPDQHEDRVPGGRSFTRRRWSEPTGRVLVESWTVHGLGHAWSGGRAGASYSDPTGPDAAAAMAGFFGIDRPR